MRCEKARKNISLAQDSRLQPSGVERMQAHLDTCPACRDWQNEQAWLLALMKTPQELPQPSADFYAVLRHKIDGSQSPARSFAFFPGSFRPALLGAAMFLILVFSALLGFFLSGRLDAPAAEPFASVFSRTMNLDAFADLPSESFGAVYERLLLGELQ
jgi:hypothetical protein